MFREASDDLIADVRCWLAPRYTCTMARTQDRSGKTSLTYADSGVDIEAGDRAVSLMKSMLRRTHGPRVMGRHGAFAGLFRLDYNEKLFQRNYRDPVLVACTDGVGTKVKIACDIGIYNTIGIDCVAMNINDLIVEGAEPLFFLDYIGMHSQDPETTAGIVEGIARGCEISGCALLGGECAEMPDIYAEGDFDLAGFAVGVLELHRAIDPMRVEPGDIVIGLASDGLHSNGFSLVRKIVDAAGLELRKVYEELHSDDAGGGPTPQTPVRESGACTLGEVLLTPTRIYARPIVKLLRRYTVKRIVSGMAHITGGGLEGNVSRALHEKVNVVIDRSTWDVPAVFRFLQEHGSVDETEMWRVFNMGIGYVLIVRPAFADSVVRQLERMGERATVIGEVTRGAGDVVLK